MIWIAKRLVLNNLVATCLSDVEYENLSYAKFLQENAPSLKHMAKFINSANWNQQTPHH
jgi:hypothetical protein